METENQKIKFNPSILVHNTPKVVPSFRMGPITISDLNAEIATMDKGMEFIPHVGEKDQLLDAFMAENGGSSDTKNNEASQS